MNPRSSLERLRSKLEEVKTLKLRVESLKGSFKLLVRIGSFKLLVRIVKLHEQQARITKLHEQLKISKLVDGVYEEARLEDDQKIHPGQSHPDNSLQGFFRRQALQNGSSDSSPEEDYVWSTASLREALATWSNRYDGLQY
jgi:hypothetical protein